MASTFAAAAGPPEGWCPGELLAILNTSLVGILSSVNCLASLADLIAAEAERHGGAA